MSTRNWFRHTTWSDDDQRDFFARLAMARPHKRAQYIYIQAATLLESHDRGNTQAALGLLDLCLAHYAPSDDEIENIQHMRARTLEDLRQTDAAIDAYRLALQARRDAPNMRSTAPLDFAYLIVHKHRTELYAEAMEALTQYADPVVLLFPNEQYRYAAACVIIAQEMGETEKAKDFAVKALQAASRTDSGLSHHPGIGLVRSIDMGMETHLKRILKPAALGWLRSKG